MNEYFVYALVDPRDGSIFYIGKFDKFYGEDAVQHRYNKSVCHRGKLNGRYKDGKLCKTYNK